MKKKKCDCTRQSLYWVCDDCKKVYKAATELDMNLCGYVKVPINEVEHFQTMINEHINLKKSIDDLNKKREKEKAQRFLQCTGIYNKLGMLTLPYRSDLVKRSDGRVEWICPHNVGHTLTASIKKGTSSVHGCDGCCNTQEYKDANEEYSRWIKEEKMTNKLIKDRLRKKKNDRNK